MKKFLICLIVLLSITFLFSNGTNNGIYAVVTVSKYKKAVLRKEPKIFSTVIARIQPDIDILKTTWNTSLEGKEYWIEVIYEGVNGWIKRSDVTLRDWIGQPLSEEYIDDVLYKLASSFQKGSFKFLESFIYPVRGLGLYSYSVGRTSFYDKKHLDDGWYYLSDKRFTGGTTINYHIDSINNFLKKDFSIHSEIKHGDENLPVEIRNFNFITAQSDKEKLLIGFEIWNDRPYIAVLALFKL